MVVESSDFVAGAAAAVATSLITYVLARLSKRSDARAQAEAALIESGPTIIKLQNDRIDQLSRDFQALWQREQECQVRLSDCQRRIDRLERGHLGGGK